MEGNPGKRNVWAAQGNEVVYHEAPRDEEFHHITERISKVVSRLGIEVTPDKLEQSQFYLRELLRWNKAFNLVGRRQSFEDVLTLFLDSLTPLVFKGLFAETAEVLDIGSGAGMPGIPLYIIGGPFALTMVESQRKKVTFIRHICRGLNLSEAVVFPERLEQMRRDEDFFNRFDIGLARAVMEPLRLVRAATPLISEGGVLVLFLGRGDAERLRKEAIFLGSSGWKLEALRSTQRYVGRDNFLALLKKGKAPAKP